MDKIIVNFGGGITRSAQNQKGGRALGKSVCLCASSRGGAF